MLRTSGWGNDKLSPKSEIHLRTGLIDVFSALAYIVADIQQRINCCLRSCPLPR